MNFEKYSVTSPKSLRVIPFDEEEKKRVSFTKTTYEQSKSPISKNPLEFAVYNKHNLSELSAKLSDSDIKESIVSLEYILASRRISHEVVQQLIREVTKTEPYIRGNLSDSTISQDADFILVEFCSSTVKGIISEVLQQQASDESDEFDIEGYSSNMIQGIIDKVVTGASK